MGISTLRPSPLHGPVAFPWLSASILFPISASLLIPFIPDKGDGKQIRWFALGIALVTFLLTVGGYLNGYDPAVASLMALPTVAIRVPPELMTMSLSVDPPVWASSATPLLMVIRPRPLGSIVNFNPPGPSLV